jgi:hypothetical protein
MKAKFHLLESIVGYVLALIACNTVWAALPKPADAASYSVNRSLADHEARRAKFQQLCAKPTPSQRETLQIWAKVDNKAYGPKFCTDVEYQYFGTKDKPNTWHTVAFGGVDNIRDYSPFQYFGNVMHLGIGSAAADLSPFVNYIELESFSISDSKEIFDISVVAKFKNLKTLSLQNVRVISLAPLAGLSKLEKLNLHVERHTGLPGRKGFEALRGLASLRDLSIDVAEPIGDQLKKLGNLESIVIYGRITDVCSFAGLKKMTSLFLIESGIKDVSCLKDLKRLEFINLRGNPIKSLATLAPLPALRNLYVKNTQIEDLSALTGNPNMYILETDGAPLRRCSPKTAEDITKGVSCFNADGTEKSWWKRLLRL